MVKVLEKRYSCKKKKKKIAEWLNSGVSPSTHFPSLLADYSQMGLG